MNATIALKIQKEHCLQDPKRIYRAAEIVAKGEIRLVPNGNFIAAAHSKSAHLTSYQVNLRNESCQCEDSKDIFDANGKLVREAQVCKHLIAALLLQEQRRCKTYDDYLAPRLDPIAQREQMAKAHKAKRVEWTEEFV